MQITEALRLARDALDKIYVDCADHIEHIDSHVDHLANAEKRRLVQKQLDAHAEAIGVIDAVPANPAAAQEAVAQIDAYRHVANEWADCACNGLQAIRNIADGIETDFENVRKNITSNLEHCQKVSEERYRRYPKYPADPAKAEPRDAGEWKTPPQSWRMLLMAVIDLLCAVDERHDTQQVPLKFSAPYGAVNRLRAALGMVAPEKKQYEQRNAGEWLLIETAPRDGTPILLGWVGGAVEEGYWCSRPNYWGETGWYGVGSNDSTYSHHPIKPSHWMPLPSAPTAHATTGGDRG